MGQWTHKHHVHVPMYKGVMHSLLQQTTKEHICVGPIFVIFRHLSLCEGNKSSPSQTIQPCPLPIERSVPYRCVYCIFHCFPSSTNIGVG
jgi:hypothetical protein